MDAAALAIVDNGAKAVYIKGGHLHDTPVDVFWDGTHLRHYEAPRIAGDMRGTGCALAMTMAAALAHGHNMRSAIRAGREIVRHLIPLARPLGAVRVVP
jgi:hydroxymethylpyrimidine/phosphomethylpyrimidine kinase